MRTRQEILEIIDKGQTINIRGVDYNKANRHRVPSEAELALGDKKKEEEAEVNIQSQMEKLEAELKKLQAAKAAREKKEESPKTETSKQEESSAEPSKKGGVVTGDKAAEPTNTSGPAKAETKSDKK